MEYKLITTAEGVQSLCTSLLTKEVIGLDTETTALQTWHGKLRLIQINDGEHIYIIDCFKLPSYRALLPLKVVLESKTVKKIVHHLKFESAWFRAVLGAEIKTAFDTLLAAKLVSFTDKASLEAVVKKYLGVELSKEEQTSNWGANELSLSQYEYAARDTFYLPQLRLKLLEELRQTDQLKVAGLEFETAPIIAHVESSGFPLDKEMYTAVCEELTIRRDQKAIELLNLLEQTITEEERNELDKQKTLFDAFDSKPLININSWQQVTKAYGKLGIELHGTSEKAIKPLLRKHPELKFLAEYRKSQKLVTAYGSSILEFIDPITGRIHPDFNQLGAETGRMSARKPNVQQVPHEESFRSCWRPSDPDKVFVISDYGQIELRILAFMAKDKYMTEAYEKKWDLHSATAKGVFNLNCPIGQIKKTYPAERGFAKTLNFAVVYGSGPQALSDKTGQSFGDSKKMIKGFYETYPQVSEWLRKQEIIGPLNHRVRTLTNRLIQIDYDPENPKGLGGARRNSRNGPIQGSSADMIKRSLVLLYPQLKNYDAKIVNAVHDELIVETDKSIAEEIKFKMEKSMIDAANELMDFPVEVESAIGNSWAAKK